MLERLRFFALCMLLAASALAAESAVSRSVFAGGSVEITEAQAGDVRGVGGHILVNAPVAGRVRLAGGEIEIGDKATIAEDAAIAGGHVVVNGAVNGNLKVGAGHVKIDGQVGGDATIAAGVLELGPNARIGGGVRFRGGRLDQDPAAQVTGGIEHTTHRHRHHEHDDTFLGRYSRGWFWTIGLMVLAAIAAASIPGPSRRMAEELQSHPWKAPLLGFIALTTIPVAAVLVMITIIGIPLGLLALIGYAALLLIGYVCVAVVVGGMLLDRFKADVAGTVAWRVGAAVLAMLALSLLARLPVVGGVAVFVALIVGVGMIATAILRRRPPASAAPATA
jgi:cytoskeletal protein CcmA (bactofilin family)